MSELAGPLRHTALYDFHVSHGGRMVDFAGYELPVHYVGAGVVAEHLHTRASASLFDVSHMAAIELVGPGTAVALEHLVPSNLLGLTSGQLRYTVLTTEGGGILDDMMVTAWADDHLGLVVNASRTEIDLAHLSALLPAGVQVRHRRDLGLLALQGPKAATVLGRLAGPDVVTMPFMTAGPMNVAGIRATLSRCGYTGEDGFELLAPVDRLVELAERILAEEEVALAGLGARDTLRLEAGLCLYGNDLTEDTTPVEAGLSWIIQRRRREQGGFFGAARILAQLREGPPRLRVGLKPEGRRPIRAGSILRRPDRDSDATVGSVSSGGYGPTIGGPVAVGYVVPDSATVGTQLVAMLPGRANPEPIVVTDAVFVPHRYRQS